MEQTTKCDAVFRLVPKSSELFYFLLSIPVENFEDHSAPPSPDEKDSGFFMLRKDSERRATLHRIMTEDQDKVVANLTEALSQVGDRTNHQERRDEQNQTQLDQQHQVGLLLPSNGFYPLSPASYLQGSEEMKLKPQHISTLVVSLADFVRMADRKIIANTLSQLKLELDFDSTAISQLQVVLFGFQDAVSIKKLKHLKCFIRNRNIMEYGKKKGLNVENLCCISPHTSSSL